MAKPFNDEGGSGFHVHVSLGDDGGANVFGDPRRAGRALGGRAVTRSGEWSGTRARSARC